MQNVIMVIQMVSKMKLIMTTKRMTQIIKMARMKNSKSSWCSRELSLGFKIILTGQPTLSRKSIDRKEKRPNLMLLLIIRSRNLSCGGADLTKFTIENNSVLKIMFEQGSLVNYFRRYSIYKLNIYIIIQVFNNLL